MLETQKPWWHRGPYGPCEEGAHHSKSSFANKQKLPLSEHIVNTHCVWVFTGNKAGLEI